MVSNVDTVTILVVEDDPTVASLVRAVLNDVPGWSALVAYTAKNALDLLGHVRADVLVVDVNLPGMSGVEMLSQLRRERPDYNPAVVMMSANVTPQRVEAVLGPSGFSCFLPKPFDIDDLISAVANAMAQRNGAGDEDDDLATVFDQADATDVWMASASQKARRAS